MITDTVIAKYDISLSSSHPGRLIRKLATRYVTHIIDMYILGYTPKSIIISFYDEGSKYNVLTFQKKDIKIEREWIYLSKEEVSSLGPFRVILKIYTR